MMSYPHSVVTALVPAGLLPVEVLADAMSSEARLIDDLIAIMRRQRTAVAHDDLQGVDDSVFATHRVLLTLNQARLRRRALNRMLGEREDVSLDALEDMLGARMTPQLATLRDDLKRSARSLAREVSLNRQVLRQALAGGEAYVRTLTGAPADATYQPPLQCAERGTASVLINRQA